MKNYLFIVVLASFLFNFARLEEELFAVDWIMRLNIDDMNTAEKVARENNFSVVERTSENFFAIKPIDSKSKTLNSDEQNIKKNPAVKSLEKVRYLKWGPQNRFGSYTDLGSIDNKK